MNRDLGGVRQPRVRTRTGLTALFVLLLWPLGRPFLSGPFRPSPVHGQQFTFVPQVTPLDLTVTPQPTVPVTVQLQATPGPQGPAAVETPAPPVNVSGGDETVGFDFIEGADVPTWRIWSEGESIIITVRPDGAAVGTLLSAFQLEASERATAIANRESANTTFLLSLATFGVGAVGAVGGVAVAIPSCAGVPLTFWAMGGTGWTCAGGIATAAAGIGADIVSGIVGVVSLVEKARAGVESRAAEQEAKDLFEALKGYAAP